MTPKQAELLRYLSTVLDKTGVSPSYAEFAEALALKSKAGVFRLVEGLIDRGYIAREGGKSRNLTLTAYARATLGRAASASEHVLAGFTDGVLVVEMARRGYAVRLAQAQP